jgi:hypothetical protein
MIKLSLWEVFIVQAAISLLSVLASTLKNTTEIAALQAAIQFLQALLGGTIATTAAVPVPPIKP